ncbi:hypothetical protein ABZ656_10945 [Streptomyces sp. NPDC007095]|uniref:hypothetical protein n=1 Tax=Streptomyces sp. NPDC007095 TaxID=3154482 RepID=UPI003411ADDB
MTDLQPQLHHLENRWALSGGSPQCRVVLIRTGGPTYFVNVPSDGSCRPQGNSP